jgi:long-chain fatty acid transport protein
MRDAFVRPALPAALLALLAAGPAPALASGFQLVEQNGSGLGNAYAGQAAGAEDASAIYFNPSLLTRLPGKQLVVSVSGIGISTRFSDAASTRPFLPAATPIPIPVSLGSAGGNAGGLAPVPNLYGSWHAASRLWLGLGVNVPFGLKTEWEDDWVGRFHSIKSDVRTVNINPTLAFEVNEILSLGVGASYQRISAELTQSVAYGGISTGAAASLGGPAAAAGILAQLGPGGMSREGVGSIEGDDWSWGWNAGLMLKLGQPGRLGVSYRSRVKHTLEGDAVFADAPTFATTGPLGPLGAGLNARFAPGAVETDIDLPETVSVAAAYQGDRVEVLADWTWTGWNTIESLPIKRADGSMLSEAPLRFEDTWRIGLGVNYAVAERWMLRLGTAFDRAPVQDTFRTPRLPDQDRTWAAAGFQYKVGKKGALDIGYAHLFIKDASSALPNQDDAKSAPSGVLIGTYDENVDIVSVQYRLSF